MSTLLWVFTWNAFQCTGVSVSPAPSFDVRPIHAVFWRTQVSRWFENWLTFDRVDVFRCFRHTVLYYATVATQCNCCLHWSHFKRHNHLQARSQFPISLLSLVHSCMGTVSKEFSISFPMETTKQISASSFLHVRLLSKCFLVRVRPSVFEGSCVPNDTRCVLFLQTELKQWCARWKRRKEKQARINLLSKVRDYFLGEYQH